MKTQAQETLNFTTTLIGDTVRLGADEFEVIQKFQTERRLILHPVGSLRGAERSVCEFEYNRSAPVLIRGKGKA